MERFFDTVWRGLIGGALFLLVLPFLSFLIGEKSGGAVLSWGGVIASGLLRGCIYGLVALALTLIYRAQRLVNFAQGDFVALGAVSAFAASAVLAAEYWTRAALSIALVSALAVLSGAFVRPLAPTSLLRTVMATLGLGFLIRVLTEEIAQERFSEMVTETPFLGKEFIIAGTKIPFQGLALILITAGLCGGLLLFVRHSRWGSALRAIGCAGEDALSDAILRRSGLIAWGLAGGLGAAAGILLAPLAGLTEDMSLIVFKAIPAAVLGGFGSLRGALTGGLLIGAAEAGAGLYISDSAERMTAYVILLVVLVIRPRGLFGTSQAFRKIDGPAFS